jgi:hypothetical protein
VEEAEKTIQQLNEVDTPSDSADTAAGCRSALLHYLRFLPSACPQFAAKKVEECDEMEKRKAKFEVRKTAQARQADGGKGQSCSLCPLSLLLSAVQKLYKKVADAHQHCLAPASTIRVDYADGAAQQQHQQQLAAEGVQAAPAGPIHRSPRRTSPGAHISPQHAASQLPLAYNSGAHLSGHAGVGGYQDSDAYASHAAAGSGEVQLPRPPGYYYQPQQPQQHRPGSLQMEQRMAYADQRRQPLPMRETRSDSYCHQQDRSRKSQRAERTAGSR